jgi:hypothetical protein
MEMTPELRALICRTAEVEANKEEREKFSEHCLRKWYDHVRAVLKGSKIILESEDDFIDLCNDSMDNMLDDFLICHNIAVQIQITYKRMMQNKEKI